MYLFGWIVTLRRGINSTFVENCRAQYIIIMEGSSDNSHLVNHNNKEESMWSEIPPELFTLILERLSFTDVLNCKPVCVSWRQMATTHTIYLSLKLEDPLLIVPDQSLLSFVTGEGTEDFFDDDYGYKWLYSFAKKEFILFDKVSAKKSCLGSSEGWLIFGSRRNTLYAFNPFLDAGFQLIPSAVNIPMRCMVYKAIIWGDPILNNNDYGVVLMVHCDGGTKLYFATCRDHALIELNSPVFYYDVTCHNNRIYGLTYLGLVEAWDLNNANPEKVLDIELSFPKEVVEKSQDLRFWSSKESLYSRIFYLVVDSMGEIFLVKRYVAEFFDKNHNVCLQHSEERDRRAGYLTILFKVYKLDFDGEEWAELDSLGERILFLGRNQSALLSSKDFPGYEKNSIYFTDGYWDNIVFDRYRMGHDMGIFNVADGGIRRFCRGYNIPDVFYKPVWVVRDAEKSYQLNP